MAITKADLVKRALERLAVIQPNESLEPNHQATAVSAYDSIYDELSDSGDVTWPNTGDNTEEIPQKFVRPLRDMLAADLAPHFGKSEPVTLDDRGEQTSIRVAGLRRIRAMTTNDWVPQTVPGHYF